MKQWFGWALCVVAMSGCSPDQPLERAEPSVVTVSSNTSGVSNTSTQWTTTGGDAAERRYSPLDQINQNTVSELGLSWFYEFDTQRGQEATPLVVDGVLYTTTAWNKVFAFNAQTGALLWQYDPGLNRQDAVKYCCDVVNRGLAYADNKVFMGALDGRLLALNAETGTLVWSTQTVTPNSYGSITGAPRIVKEMVIIGHSGADYGERGYVSAYEVATGEQRWRFYTVPGNPADTKQNPALQMAATTWTGEWWKNGGGGTVWDSMAFDVDADLLYIGVGNGFPHSRSVRSPDGGDNLFLSSIVVLKPDSGDYVWHYQTTPGDSWDFTATQPMILADLDIKGAPRKVIMQAPKNGFFYVLDRLTGELLSANNFVETRWASAIDMTTGRPVENPYYRENPAANMPSYFGGHNWQPMAYSPQTQMAYFPWHEVEFPSVGGIVVEGAGDTERLKNLNTSQPKGAQKPLSAKGGLVAWNVAENREAWRVEHPWAINGGALATAGGLVFEGTAGGTFNAYHAQSGQQLWSWKTDNGILAGPISYAIDGKQYVAVMSGYGGAPGLAYGYASPDRPRLPGRLYVFALNGTASAPPQEWPDKQALPIDSAQWPDLAEGLENAGEGLFMAHCIRCHGIRGDSGILPDLRYSPMILNAAAFDAVVIQGALKDNGMVAFGNVMSAHEAESIRHYLLTLAAGMTADDSQP